MSDMHPVVRIAVKLSVLLSLTQMSSLSAAAPVSARADMPFSIMLGLVKSGSPAAQHLVFTTASNLPLYYLDKSAVTACDAACQKLWSPFLAGGDDRPLGEWTLVARGDAKQWAYRGKPVYTYAKDSALGGDKYPLESYRFISNPNDALPLASGDGVGKKWHVAGAVWNGAFKKPTSISVAEHLLVQGQILVTTRGTALYAFNGDRQAVAKLSEDWQPAQAGLAELPVGEFSIIELDNGIRQWAYRKQPLFSYKRDINAADLNGRDAARGMGPAIAVQYFMPADVAIAMDRPGGRLTQSSTGKALYARDRIDWTQIRMPTRGLPVVGQSIGIAGCNADCEREWAPFLAPLSAQPSGYWNLIARPDGSKQWAYRGFALYTYTNEAPGIVHHSELYDAAYSETTQEQRPAFMGIGLYWRVATP